MSARKLPSTDAKMSRSKVSTDDEVLECVRHALHDSHAAQRKEQDADIKSHQTEYDRLQGRIHAMCVDKLDSLVDAAFFERMSARVAS
jgi:site-specific DNA recombinase